MAIACCDEMPRIESCRMATGSAEGVSAAETRPIRSASIVLLGAFNPLILEPQWLANHDVITDQDLQTLQESGQALVSPELTGLRFRTFALEAARDRIQVIATEELETPLLLADVVVNVFTLLSHTPVRAMGLNHLTHRPVEAERVERLWARFAPSDAAQQLMPGTEVESVQWSADRPDDHAGLLRASVAPSRVLTGSGIFLSLNDHFDLGENGSGANAAELLADEWQASLQRADTLFESILAF